MRIILAAIAAILMAGAVNDRAAADPYRWCADYGIGSDAGTNCYFVTLEQCRAAASGVGGFCRPNGFYTGPSPDSPTTTTRSTKNPRH